MPIAESYRAPHSNARRGEREGERLLLQRAMPRHRGRVVPHHAGILQAGGKQMYRNHSRSTRARARIGPGGLEARGRVTQAGHFPGMLMLIARASEKAVVRRRSHTGGALRVRQSSGRRYLFQMPCIYAHWHANMAIARAQAGVCVMCMCVRMCMCMRRVSLSRACTEQRHCHAGALLRSLLICVNVWRIRVCGSG